MSYISVILLLYYTYTDMPNMPQIILQPSPELQFVPNTFRLHYLTTMINTISKFVFELYSNAILILLHY